MAADTARLTTGTVNRSAPILVAGAFPFLLIGRRRVSRWLFHRIAFRHAVPPQYGEERDRQRFFEYGVESTRRFFERFEGGLDVRGKSVLDVGAGRGEVVIELAHRGAERVVGVDIKVPDQALKMIAEDPVAAGRVELVATDGRLRELGSDTFDLVLSKDSFEHFADPESFIFTLARFVKPGGALAIGFGPLWKSPTGGHIEYMTRVPWAHLLFPEEVIMDERRRFRPEDGARTFEEIPGGINRMTLARFLAIMESSGLERVYFATNVSDNRIVRLMKVLSRVRPLREFFTTNVYGVWRKPE
jgi:SAM-dependent methyltransferase